MSPRDTLGFFWLKIYMIHKKIIIIGAGPVGLSLAISLAKQGKLITLIDQSFYPKKDQRILALSYASSNFLKKIDSCPQRSTTIQSIQISHDGLGISKIKSEDMNIPTLGFTISYDDLCAKLLETVLQIPQIELITAQVTHVKSIDKYAIIELIQDNHTKIITSDLVILAEGGKLSVDNLAINKDYQQMALVAHVAIKSLSKNVAFEHFGKLGPLVLLPYQEHYIVVWSLANILAKTYLNSSEQFIFALDDEFTKRLGGALLLKPLASFHLKLIKASSRVQGRIIRVGNAAQTLHPISAQGLNLGLRDVKELAKILNQEHEINLTSLQKYSELRNQDVNSIIKFTDFLATKMETRNSILRHLRGAGLIGLSNFPYLQNAIAKILIFGA